jgi:hypothetical protein
MANLLLFSNPAHSARINKPDTSMFEGIRVQSQTRVVAGKYFQVKLVSSKSKITGICWMDWELSSGFSIPKEFRMNRGSASVKILPIKPGPGTMFFYCGIGRNSAEVGGSSQIYIAP